MSTDQLINRVVASWPELKKEFLYPVLESPQCVTLAPTIPSTLDDFHVVVNPEFIAKMTEVGVPEPIVISAAVARAVNRHMRVPCDFFQAIQMYVQMRKTVLDAELARRFLDTFLTILNDMDLYRHRGMAAELTALYRASIAALPAKDLCMYYRLIVGLLQEKWCVDLGLRHDVHWAALVAELCELDYIDSSDLPAEARRFGEALQRFGFKLEEEDTTKPKDRPVVWPIETANPLLFRDVGAGIRLFLAEADPAEAWVILSEFTRSDRLIGACLLLSRWQFYDELARARRLTIAPRPLAVPESRTYGVSLRDWQPEDGFDNLAVLSSFAAKICWPGLSKKWLLIGPDSQLVELDYPDLIVIVDSSGSMPNANEKSSPAVLSAVAAANIYLRHGSKVAVYNFASSDLVLEPTTDRARVLRYIAAFQNGGTTVNPAVIARLLGKLSRGADILLISDLGIGNWDEAVKTLESCARVHRVFVIAFGDGGNTLERFCSALRGRIEACQVARAEDIPQIVLGAVRRSFAAYQGGKHAQSRTP